MEGRGTLLFPGKREQEDENTNRFYFTNFQSAWFLIFLTLGTKTRGMIRKQGWEVREQARNAKLSPLIHSCSLTPTFASASPITCSLSLCSQVVPFIHCGTHSPHKQLL